MKNLEAIIRNIWENHFGYVYEEDTYWMVRIKKTIERSAVTLYNDLTYLIDVNDGLITEDGYHIFIENLEAALPTK